MDNTKFKLNSYHLSGKINVVISTAFVEDVVDIRLIVEESGIKY